MKHVVGINLRAARQNAGMTQRELANKTGVTQNYIAQIEGGRRAPSLEVLVHLAESIDVQPADLLSGEGVTHELQRLIDIVGLERLRTELDELAQD